jgi:hypothetical protein
MNATMPVAADAMTPGGARPAEFPFGWVCSARYTAMAQIWLKD